MLENSTPSLFASEMLKENGRRKLRHVWLLSQYYRHDPSQHTPQRMAVRAFKCATNIWSIYKLAHVITEVDDTLDDMPPEKLLELGQVNTGQSPCDFLLAPEIQKSGIHETLEKLSDDGLAPLHIQYGLTNIHAVLVAQQARAAIEYMHTSHPRQRTRLLALDCHLAQSTVIHVLEQFKGTLAADPELAEKPLTLKDLRRHYPVTARASNLFEYIDHLADFVIDMREELETGRPAPSWIAGILEKRGQLKTKSGDIAPVIRDFIESSQSGFVKPDTQPACVKDAISTGDAYYKKQIEKLPARHQRFWMDFWNVIKAEGMTAQHKKASSGRHPN